MNKNDKFVKWFLNNFDGIKAYGLVHYPDWIVIKWFNDSEKVCKIYSLFREDIISILKSDLHKYPDFKIFVEDYLKNKDNEDNEDNDIFFKQSVLFFSFIVVASFCFKTGLIYMVEVD